VDWTDSIQGCDINTLRLRWWWSCRVARGVWRGVPGSRRPRPSSVERSISISERSRSGAVASPPSRAHTSPYNTRPRPRTYRSWNDCFLVVVVVVVVVFIVVVRLWSIARAAGYTHTWTIEKSWTSESRPSRLATGSCFAVLVCRRYRSRTHTHREPRARVYMCVCVADALSGLSRDWQGSLWEEQEPHRSDRTARAREPNSRRSGRGIQERTYLV